MKKVIAIDLGGTKISAAVVNEDGKILKLVKEPTRLKEGWPGLKKQIVQIVKSLLLEHKQVSKIGVGSAGPLNAAEGTLLDPTNFGWKTTRKIQFKKEIERALGKKIVFDNDAVAAVLGEAWKGKGGPDCMSVTLGTGVGVGVLVNGRIHRGRGGLHPELGHLVLRTEDFSQCECGVPGCAEGLLSGVNFAKRFSRKAGQDLTAKEIEDLAREGFEPALESFDEYAQLLAQYICSLIVVSYPKKIIFSGSFTEASPFFLSRSIELVGKAMQRQQKSIKIIPEVRTSTLKNQSGLLGAAYMALNSKA
jgi:glucokinase